MNLTAQLEDLFLNNFKNSKQKPERQLRSLGGQPLPHAVHRAWAGSAGILPPRPPGPQPPRHGSGEEVCLQASVGAAYRPCVPLENLGKLACRGSKLACCGV